jgi:hypothetical protein
VTDDEFLKAFEACKLSRAAWTHEAHVRMAWLYLVRSSSYRMARNKVRDGIKKLNAAFSARSALSCSTFRLGDALRNPKLTGYHETITMVFVRLIANRLHPDEDFAAFRDRNSDLFDRKLSALLKYYTAERLFSEKAKQGFLEPDRAPLPKVSSQPATA